MRDYNNNNNINNFQLRRQSYINEPYNNILIAANIDDIAATAIANCFSLPSDLIAKIVDDTQEIIRYIIINNP